MKKIKYILACLFSLTLLVACGSQETAMQGSSIVPAAQGNVTVDSDKNNNTNMTVKVQHLAPPQKISAGATDYVVWIQPEGARNYQNVGALRVDKDLQGVYSTTVPYKNFKILVTPEVSSMVQNPSGPSVFQQNVIRK